MTKINLLNSLGVSQAPGAAAPVEAVSGDVVRQGLLKIVIILLFPVGLFIYQQIATSALEAQKAEIQTKIQAVQAKVGTYGEAGPRYKRYSAMKEQIDKQASIIRTLAVGRLREVKALDSLQSMTPPQVWFKSVKINAGLVAAQGYASNEEGISALYSALSNSSLFSRFEPGVQSEETTEGAHVKKFEVQFQIGREVAAPETPAKGAK